MRQVTFPLIVLLMCGLLSACQPVRPEPPLSVVLTKPEDAAKVQREGQNIIVDLYSPSGIGGAQLQWPDRLDTAALVLRLHLEGLEGLQLANASGKGSLSVSSSPPYAMRSEGSMQGVEVQRGEGVFEVRLDGSWLGDGGLNVQWIDFYRS